MFASESESSRAEGTIQESPQCAICLCSIENPINLCVDDHEATCRDCSINYLESQVSGAYFGSCPCITCPSLTHQKSKRRKVILFNRWSEIVRPETANKYKALASHLLAFLCGGCHTLKTLDVGFDASSCGKIEKLLTDNEGNSEKYSSLRSAISTFSLGEMELEEFYLSLGNTFFPQLSVLNDTEAWEIFMPLLKTIEEPERRCNLHLRYLRDRPRMKTLCCNREHCFRCKIKDFHEGKSCLEYSSNLDNSIVTCPSCGIALARGDGCNTITCVCGKQFSWSGEKENTERSFAFRDAFPTNTSDSCANILCTTATPSSSNVPLIMQAKAWQIRNRIEVNRSLRRWFKQNFAPCPSQMCAKLVPEQQPDGVREAMELWRTEFSKEVHHCKAQNNMAIASLFTTMYPLASERAVAAHWLVSMNSLASSSQYPNKDGLRSHSLLVTSATRWIDAHREEYKTGVEQWELRSARQFIFLYGRQPLLSFKTGHQNIFCVQSFNRSISNTELNYTNNDTTVERPGSASCYPAAFADLTGERCMFRVQVNEAPRSSNWLTFGLARRGMANSSSDGVGRTSNSWGLSDDRSSSSSNMIAAASGTEVAQFRKIVNGDILTAIVDTTEGWLEVSLNENEKSYRFTIPVMEPKEYVFAMTFANDHRVTIVSDAPFMSVPLAVSALSSSSPAPQETASTAASSSITNNEPGIHYLNSDHSCMFNNFKKHLKLILSPLEKEDASRSTVSTTSSLMTSGNDWLEKYCESSRALARSRVELMLPILDSQLHMRRMSGKSKSSVSGANDAGEKLLRELSCNMLLDALSWYRHNLDQIARDLQEEMALNFSLIHGESATFIAAMTSAQAHQSASSVDGEELQAAIAYMRTFADEMNEWYDLDAMSGDPLVEHIAKGCRCLPRHYRSCPVVKKQGGH